VLLRLVVERFHARSTRVPFVMTILGSSALSSRSTSAKGTQLQPSIGMNSKIRILVAEDHLVARVGVSAIINCQPDMEVVAEAVNGKQAVERFRKYLPDITLLDMRMPIMSGLEATIKIRTEFPEARLIALSSYGGDEDIRRALAGGVQAYLTKDVLREELLKTIRTVNVGKTYLPKALAAAVDANRNAPQLSEREVEVLELVARGLANKEIAYALNIAETTARNHVKNILHKLGVHDRTLATTAALQRGIIHLQ
jgi:two-component system NarL family response regulator